MLRSLAPLVVAGALGGQPLAPDLATAYEPGRTLRFEVATTIETSSEAEMIRDGEPVDMRGRGGGESTVEHELVYLDAVVEAADGVPTRVRRTFETVEGETEGGFGEGAFDCPLDGAVLVLTADEDGDVGVEVVEGDEPDEMLLELHRIDAFTDAMLPEGEVDEGATWELEDADVLRLLGLDLERALYRRGDGGGGGGREGRGGGRRGGFGGGRGVLGFLTDAEWDATATLASVDESHDDETCARIELRCEARGDLPENDFGGDATSEGEFEASVEGFLLVSLDSRRPVALELEGEFRTESLRELERGGMTMEFRRNREGTITRRASITIDDASTEE